MRQRGVAHLAPIAEAYTSALPEATTQHLIGNNPMSGVWVPVSFQRFTARTVSDQEEGGFAARIISKNHPGRRRTERTHGLAGRAHLFAKTCWKESQGETAANTCRTESQEKDSRCPLLAVQPPQVPMSNFTTATKWIRPRKL